VITGEALPAMLSRADCAGNANAECDQALRRFFQRHTGAVHLDGTDEPAIAEQCVLQHADFIHWIVAAPALLDHHFFAIVGPAFLGGVAAEVMTNRGVALIRAVKTLQTAGYSVGLVAYLYGKAKSNTLVNVVVKTPDEPLNETLVAAAFAHPSFFRTLGHNVAAKLNGCNGGMNSLKKPANDLFKDSFIDSEQLVILDGCFEYKDCETPYRAEQWIINEIETAIEQRNNA